MRFSCVILVTFFGLASCTLTSSEESSSSSEETRNLNSKEVETVVLFIQTLVQLAYREDKLEVIEDITHTLQQDSDTSNITLIGSQNIYNKDGGLKEVRTIELSFPNFQKKLKSDDDLLDTEDSEKLKEIRNIFQTLAIVGLNIDVAYIEQNKFGDTQELFYLANDLLVFKNNGITFVNKTIHLDTIDQIPSKSDGELTSTLMFDKNSTFLKDKSTVVSELFATIENDDENPNRKLVETVFRSLVNVALEAKNLDDVPQNLQRRLEHLYPKILFTVTEDEPAGLNINKDFAIYLTYDYVDLDPIRKYTVYGYKL